MSIAPDFLRHLGGVPVGMEVFQPETVRWVYHATSSQFYKNLRKKVDPTKLHAEITTAETKVTSGQNEVVFMTPESHTLASAMTWDSSNTHIIGMHSGSPWSNNVQLTQSGATAQSPAITVSGSDNYIANIHFVMAGSSADQHILLSNTGSGNHYENCWFEGPTNATQLDDSSVQLVQVDGGGNYFRNCVFGTTAGTSAASRLLGFTGSAYRTTFENCIFYQQVDNVAARFIEADAAFDISGPQFFRNCIFHAWWSNQADKANYLIAGGGGTRTGEMHFNGCSVVGFDDIIAAAGEAAIFFDNQLTAAPDGTYNGLVVNVTAG